MKPPDSQKAMAIRMGISARARRAGSYEAVRAAPATTLGAHRTCQPRVPPLENAEKAAAKVSVLVIMDTHRPSIATAPRGSGVVMMPAPGRRIKSQKRPTCAACPVGSMPHNNQ